MNTDKMYLINKLFNDKTIRTVWDKEDEKYYISVVDIVGAVSESDNPQVYWRVMKKRLKDEGNETVTNCNALKLKAPDGKMRSTDVVDIEGMFRIIESIPSKNAEPIKQWLAKLGSERIDEIFDPSIATQRSIDLYRAKELAKEYKPIGVEANKKIAKMGGNTAKVAREDLEMKLNKPVISSNNNINYEYENEKLEIE